MIGTAEVGGGGGGPAAAEVGVAGEGGVEVAEVFGEGAVVDAEGWAGRDGGVEYGPLVLEGAAVGGTGGEEGGYFVAAAADAEGADGSLLDLGFEKVEEAVVAEVGDFHFVEEPDVDAVGAQGGEAAVERGLGLLWGEGGALGVVGGGAGYAGETLLEAGEAFDEGANEGACGPDEAGVFCRGDAVLGGDGDVGAVALEEFAEAAFGFAIAVHGSDVEVPDAGVVGGFEDGEGVAW